MRSASLTIKVFGVYALLTGITLVAIPNVFLSLFGIPPTNEIWIRVLGAVVTALGYEYWACGAADAKAFFRASIPGRIAFSIICVGLVVLAQAPWQLLLFGAVDLLSAAWTAIALRSEITL